MTNRFAKPVLSEDEVDAIEMTLYEEYKARGWRWRLRIWAEERKLAVSEGWLFYYRLLRGRCLWCGSRNMPGGTLQFIPALCDACRKEKGDRNV